MNELRTRKAWAGWGRYLWEVCRWTVPLHAACTAGFLVVLPLRPLSDGTPGWAQHTTNLVAIAMKLNAVLAIFGPMLAATDYGVWALRPIQRSMATLMVAGWGASMGLYALVVLLWLGAMRAAGLGV
jgi:hypothetical protein